ncbi:myo-inositol-1(or 4)-monophosphatase [Enterococcus sp. PF1-24]|uniref:inositol monophosphatase family protein n=1 Tax=unclassified Enterococcus TaxID=2608891 RepID=UPI002476B963|nr:MULTISPECIES: inositol monophosphatase family protein [unclassified Enterococcus]MDH6364219.1 myo-inositol-1(or 4)-monophosphatase [Enterococcus sp. PFB1-1]MDH6401320.1 myo-inositol-1(or 4)-monophosphatase [Enterococcus sp. PF1-24]
MQNLVTEVIGWLEEAGEKIKESFKSEIEVAEKTSAKDLVTNIDKQTQQFLISKVNAYNPQAKILAEEEGYNQQDISQGQVFIIDPIDGTLNFVLEKENFCIMLAVFEEGVGKYGFIYDVMKKEIYWGSKQFGVYCNDRKLPQPKDLLLSEGLIGMNAYMHGNNLFNTLAIGEESKGIRCSGCAGIELIGILKGTRNGYISNLSPWDYAAGSVMLDIFNFPYSGVNGKKLAFEGREYFFAGTPQTYQRVMTLIK